MIQSDKSSVYHINEQFAGFFDSRHFLRYQDFLKESGIVFKDKDHVRVVLRELSQDGLSQKFVFKEYRYGKGNIRTWWPAKAKREYHNLKVCQKLGIPAVKPVAYGSQRSILKTVNSCFVITKFVENSVNLKKRLQESGNWHNDPSLQKIFTELGIIFRRLHSRNYFMYSSSTRNILIKENTPLQESRIRLLDMPYAYFAFNNRRACRAQSKDLGTLLKLPFLFGCSSLVDAFFQTYLSDPLGSSTTELKHRLYRAARAQDNRTLWTDFVHRYKRKLKICVPRFFNT